MVESILERWAISKEIHLNLGEMYLSDQRFKSYYDNAVGTGATEFLYEALKTYIK